MLKVSSRQQGCKPEFEDALARTIMDGMALSDTRRLRVLHTAQRSWETMGFGAPRLSGAGNRKRRRDAGVLRPERSAGVGAVSEVQFVRQRRDAVRCHEQQFGSVAEAEAAIAALDADAATVTSAAFQKEKAFAADKVTKRLQQAAREDLLLPSESSAGLVQAAEAEHAQMLRREVGRRRAKRRRHTEAFGSDSPSVTTFDIRGEKVYFDPSVDDVLLESRLPVNVRTLELTDAKYVVTDGVPQLSAKHLWQWAALLRGFHVSCGQPSACDLSFKYEAALLQRRRVWVSKRFKRCNVELFALLRSCVRCGPVAYDGAAAPGRRWKFLKHRHSFTKRKSRNNKDASVVALVTAKEKSKAKLVGLAHVFGQEDFFNALHCLDFQRCFHGNTDGN